MPYELLPPLMGGGIDEELLEQITVTSGDVLYPKKFMSYKGTIETGSLSLTGTATEGDVLSGKTFYSNDTTLRTGTGKMAVHIGYWGAHHDSHVTSAIFDVKAKLPNDYMNLTRDNFILGNPSIFASHGATNAYDHTGFNWSYNASTGKLSVYSNNGSWVYSCGVWCMMPNIG